MKLWFFKIDQFWWRDKIAFFKNHLNLGMGVGAGWDGEEIKI